MKTKPILRCLAKGIAIAVVFLTAFSAISATQIASQLAPSARISAVGGGNSFDPILTADGRFVLFASTSDNLVVGPGGLPMPEAVPAHMNVFLRDRQSGAISLISVNAAGTAGGNGNSFPCSISSSGQFAVFQSAASDLIAGDTNGANDVFVRDTVNNLTTLVSVSTNGTVGNGLSREGEITPDGRYVAFVSAASNLVAGDSNGISDVFVRDLQLGVTTMASLGALKYTASPNTPLTLGSSSESPVISADGRYVAFYSTAIGLISNATNSGEIYVRDLVQDVTAWVSTNAHTINASAVSANYAMSTNGQWIAYQTEGVGPPGMVFRYDVATGASDDISTNGALVTSLDIESRKIDISADGRFVAFTLTNTSGGASIQLWDAQSGVASRISGVTNVALCDFPRVDQTGRYVAFTSADTSLTTNSDGAIHVYVRDTSTDAIQLADVDTNGVIPISSIMTPFHLSGDGSVLAFDCADGHLSINSHKFDAFVRDFGSNTTEIISAPAPSLPTVTPLNLSELNSSSVSSNGQFVAFTSYSDGIVSGDTNGYPDVYVHDFATGSNTLVSVTADGIHSGSANSQEPAISADGRYVAFSSYATNLVAVDKNNAADIFLRDMQTGATVLVSSNVTASGGGNGDSLTPQISADGQRVLFFSRANNLTSSNGITGLNLFWRDLQAGVTYGLTGSGNVTFATMTPDGSNVFFAFETPPSSCQALVWNAQKLAATVVISLNYNVIDGAISADGSRAAFATLGGGTTTSSYAVDLVANTNWVLGSLALASQKHFQFSRDSRFLAYLAKDSLGTNQVYLYDFQTTSNILVSQSYLSTSGGNGPCDSPAISADGTWIAYRSAASNLVPGDNNGLPDIYLYNRLTNGTRLISASRFGAFSANGESLPPVFSGDGQTLFFESWASDLAPGDFNESSDIFAVSLPMNGSSGSTNAAPPVTVGITPGIAGGLFVTNQTYTLTWPSVTGAGYQAQFKNSLTDPDWQPLNGTVTVVGSQGSIIDFSPAPGQRFYRVLSY